jgi:plasmid stability protein
MTRNLTLAIDDDLLDKVRVLAAMKRTSVNEMVRGFLTRLVEQETSKDEAREALLKLIDESEGRGGEGWHPLTREETYSGDPRFDREF